MEANEISVEKNASLSKNTLNHFNYFYLNATFLGLVVKSLSMEFFSFHLFCFAKFL